MLAIVPARGGSKGIRKKNQNACSGILQGTKGAPRAAQTAEGLADHPLEVADMDQGTRNRFEKRVRRTADGDCWIWTGRIDPEGYGRLDVRWPGAPRWTNALAHHVAWELEGNSRPTGWTYALDHLCRVRNCVNPAHLELVTRGENVRRGVGVGRAWAAIQRAKTHCPKGHPYDEANTRVTKSGGRACRMCDRLRARRTRASRKC